MMYWTKIIIFPAKRVRSYGSGFIKLLNLIDLTPCVLLNLNFYFSAYQFLSGSA